MFGLHLLVSSATVMAAGSDRLIICRSGCNFIAMCVVVCMVGFAIDAANVG